MVRVRTMTQEEYKSNYASFKIIYGFHSTQYGNCLLAITDTDKAIAHLSFADNSYEEALEELKSNWPLTEIVQDINNETNEIMSNILSPCASVDESLSVLMKGTEFQMKVWECLTRIPVATTMTYEQVALTIGKPKASRAVGNAVMKNNIALLVPCHRVVGKSGRNKYKWGAKRKEIILANECQYP
ncbi:O-6-alkylguanine-DNA alkyltransferase [Calliopsis andreniformis]|uniref:O-6-alkylguanine-DNA alkyltransferase n=1 Tax=Calliopsis andreniformis TaxID=337506 RepID=UPI003FCE026C